MLHPIEAGAAGVFTHSQVEDPRDELGELLADGQADGEPTGEPTDEPTDEPADEAVGDADPFAGLPEPIARALRGRGFTALTPVQLAVLDADRCGVTADGVDGRDLQICSKTGSGKTVAIGLALAPALLRTPVRRDAPPEVLVVAPTRELAAQVQGELDWLYADVRDVRTLSVTGGTSVPAERRQLERIAPRIVVGTPGRLCDHVRSGALDLGAVRQLVLDEADQMLDLGFRDELEAILAELPADRRSVLVSATFPAEVQELVERYQRDPLRVDGAEPGAANSDIEHVAVLVRGSDRYAALVNVLLLGGGRQRTLVFVRTRQDTAELAERLAGDGFAALPLSGDLAQAQRTRTLNAFRNGTVHVLVATDVAARGIDVPDVSTVVQYDPPVDDAVYTHRSGRTGRAGRKGRNVIFGAPSSERRLTRMLHAAGVDASWREAPGPDDVRRVLGERQRAELAALLAAPLGAAELLEQARELLADREPAEVVARLLGRALSALPCEPMAVGAPARVRSEPAAHRPLRDEPRRDDVPRVRFTINWGRKAGATPQRILAHVCRRGDVAGQDIGAIEIGPFATTFDVDARVAPGFGRRASIRDPRDPRLTIRPAGSAGPRRRERRTA